MNTYDIYANPLNILKRQIDCYGLDIEIYHYPENDFGEIDYDAEPTIFFVRGLYHGGSGKMGASSAIRFAYKSDAGSGLGEYADYGLVILYDENNLPKTGDICYFQGYKFYLQIITDLMSIHKILDISLSVTGIVTP